MAEHISRLENHRRGTKRKVIKTFLHKTLEGAPLVRVHARPRSKLVHRILRRFPTAPHPYPFPERRATHSRVSSRSGAISLVCASGERRGICLRKPRLGLVLGAHYSSPTGELCRHEDVGSTIFKPIPRLTACLGLSWPG